MDIEVTLKDFMGSDLTVVNAARVSFDKQSDWEKGFDNDLEGLLNYNDEKLIKYLAIKSIFSYHSNGGSRCLLQICNHYFISLHTILNETFPISR